MTRHNLPLSSAALEDKVSRKALCLRITRLFDFERLRA
jgi:hypothetical protein